MEMPDKLLCGFKWATDAACFDILLGFRESLIVQAQGSNPRLQAGRFHHRYAEPLQ
jgi:hypothetical protein